MTADVEELGEVYLFTASIVPRSRIVVRSLSGETFHSGCLFQ